MPNKFTPKDKIYQELQLLTANDEFMKDVNEIRTKCKENSEEVLDDDNEPIRIDYSQSPEYKEDIEKLKKKYNLSKLYHLPLIMFCDGESEVPDLRRLENLWDIEKPETVLVFKDPDILSIWAELDPSFPLEAIKSQLEEHVVLKLYPETTKKDIIEAWPRISKGRDQLFKVESTRNSKRVNLKRDLFIYKLKKQGKTCKEIMTIINNNEKPRNGTIIGYEDVSIIIKRLENRAKKLRTTKRT